LVANEDVAHPLEQDALVGLHEAHRFDDLGPRIGHNLAPIGMIGCALSASYGTPWRRHDWGLSTRRPFCSCHTIHANHMVMTRSWRNLEPRTNGFHAFNWRHSSSIGTRVFFTSKYGRMILPASQSPAIEAMPMLASYLLSLVLCSRMRNP